MELIIATTKNNGIGLEGKMAWNCKKELQLFRRKTLGNVLIIGRKTAEKLPKLKDRVVLCLSRTKKGDNIFDSLIEAVLYAKKNYPNKKIFISGGSEIYKTAMDSCYDMIKLIHHSIMKKKHKCDVFFNIKKYLSESYVVVEKTETEDFIHYVYKKDTTPERQYLNNLKDIMNEGEIRKGRNGYVKSLFVKHLSFDLRKSFPILTTKKMFMKGIVEELLFFMRGETNTKLLEDKKVNIWKGNTERQFLDENGFKNRKEGMMGPMYGWQWRHFGAQYDEKTGHSLTEGYDQLKNLIEKIKNDPYSRRHLITDYNPQQASEGVLYPCHSLMVQFYVSGEYLDMFSYCRSTDYFLGCPFNITSSALFLVLVAKLTGKKPRMMNMTSGDAHIYEEHYEKVLLQLKRCPFKLPQLRIKKEINNLEDVEKMSSDDFELVDYMCHSGIKAKMIA